MRSFCANCGAPVEEGAAFCGSCGAPVQNAVEPMQPAVPVEPPVALPSNPSLPHRSSLPLPRRPRYTLSTSSRSTSSLSPR